MNLKKPDSMEQCLYFTKRAIDSVNVTAWVYRKKCPKCNNGLMGKPLKKNGKVDKKAQYYQCNKCSYQEKLEALENELKLEAEYKCPKCGFQGQTISEYKLRKYKNVPSYLISCEKCNEKIPLTKKLKDI